MGMSNETNLLRAVHFMTVDRVIAKEAPRQSNTILARVNIAQYTPLAIFVRHEPILQLRH